MNPALLAVLINQVALPELTRWLAGLHAANTPLTDEQVIAKLVSDTDIVVKIGEAWLAAHPQA